MEIDQSGSKVARETKEPEVSIMMVPRGWKKMKVTMVPSNNLKKITYKEKHPAFYSSEGHSRLKLYYKFYNQQKQRNI